MKAVLGTFAVLSILATLVALGATQTTPGAAIPAVAPAQTAVAAAPTDPDSIVKTYCSGCHSDAGKSGNLTLAHFDISQVGENAETVEKMIRKLRAGMMPPPGARRPDEATMLKFVETLEQDADVAAAHNPNPGGRTFQRLNRADYQHAIHDLLALDVDAGRWLPLDQMLANFDNMADAQSLSPTLLDSYLNAASAISRMAIGDRNAPSIDETYSNSQYVSQNPWDHVDGAPYGTRGGMVINHVFPADGYYVFGMTFHGGFGVRPGDNTRMEDIDISIDGEQVALLLFDADGAGGPVEKTEPVFIRAGQHRVSAAFVRRSEGPYEDLIRPHDWSWAGGGSGGSGVTALPHLRDLIVTGPTRVTGLSETPSRQKIFSCRPTSPKEERPCAQEILSRLATEAYRRQLTPGDTDALLHFYDNGVRKGGFETGIRTALEAILASPHFVLRLEREPSGVKPGQTYRISDLDLATRLSFFLWGTPPDDELAGLAATNQLSKPGELEKQTRRMLADPRASALGTRFAYQWFRLQDLDKNHPDPNFFPNFDANLGDLMKKETETFFSNLVQEDRSLLELFNADYTFVNERLARHYGFRGVAGAEFRKVQYPDPSRRGILGQGSVLVLTSLANRTSPVLRGKWVMEVLMGTPPPPPPPNVPTLDETKDASGGRMLTTRERMEKHRAAPTCQACHRFMDPIGLALDNFDVTGKWRERENGMALDTRGTFYDGSAITSPSDLVTALLKRPIPLIRTFTENLMAYSIGRPVEYYDEPTIRAITREAEKNNYRMSSFILGVIQSDAFQMKRMEPPATNNVKAAEGGR
jgi:mono/diheme cytochrome c family protein